MATTLHLLAVGRVSNGAVEMQMALPPLQTLIDYGAAVAADEDALIDALFAREYADDAPLLPADLIDYDGEAEDYEDDIEDRNIWRRGAW